MSNITKNLLQSTNQLSPITNAVIHFLQPTQSIISHNWFLPWMMWVPWKKWGFWGEWCGFYRRNMVSEMNDATIMEEMRLWRWMMWEPWKKCGFLGEWCSMEEMWFLRWMMWVLWKKWGFCNEWCKCHGRNVVSEIIGANAMEEMRLWRCRVPWTDKVKNNDCVEKKANESRTVKA